MSLWPSLSSPRGIITICPCDPPPLPQGNYYNKSLWPSFPSPGELLQYVHWPDMWRQWTRVPARGHCRRVLDQGVAVWGGIWQHPSMSAWSMASTSLCNIHYLFHAIYLHFAILFLLLSCHILCVYCFLLCKWCHTSCDRRSCYPYGFEQIWVFTEQKPSLDQQVIFVLYRYAYTYTYVCIRSNINSRSCMYVTIINSAQCLCELCSVHVWVLCMLRVVQVTGLKSVLIDYYISAVDAKGNVKKSDIYHVYVGNGTTLCSGASWVREDY